MGPTFQKLAMGGSGNPSGGNKCSYLGHFKIQRPVIKSPCKQERGRKNAEGTNQGGGSKQIQLMNVFLKGAISGIENETTEVKGVSEVNNFCSWPDCT